jgi:hypothetical protein
MKRSALIAGLFFSLPLYATITYKETGRELFYTQQLTPNKDKKALCKTLTEKENQRTERLAKKKGATKGKPLATVADACESTSLNVTIEEKSKLAKDNLSYKTSWLAHTSGDAGYLSALIEVGGDLYSMPLAPIEQRPPEEKDRQTLTIHEIKTQDFIAGGIEELIIRYSIATKTDKQTVIKESLLLCGVSKKQFTCTSPVRIAESTVYSVLTTSWRLAYEINGAKITLTVEEVNGSKREPHDKSGLSASIQEQLGTWNIPL